MSNVAEEVGLASQCPSWCGTRDEDGLLSTLLACSFSPPTICLMTIWFGVLCTVILLYFSQCRKRNSHAKDKIPTVRKSAVLLSRLDRRLEKVPGEGSYYRELCEQWSPPNSLFSPLRMVPGSWAKERIRSSRQLCLERHLCKNQIFFSMGFSTANCQVPGWVLTTHFSCRAAGLIGQRH